MSKARDGVEDLKAIDANLAAKAPIASPVFTGNVGIGVVPEAWDSNFTAVQLGDGALMGGVSGTYGTAVSSNAYFDGTWRYLTTGEASFHHQYNGQHVLNVAASGTADAAISWNNAVVIDNAGRVTTPNQPSFKVTGDNAAVSANGFGVVPFNLDSGGNDRFDNGNNYNTTNYRFVAPVSGKYFVSSNVRMDSMSGTYFRLLITKNGSENSNNGVHSIIGSGKSTNYHTMTVSGILNCAANDYLEVKYMSSDDTSWNLTLSESGFSGFLIG